MLTNLSKAYVALRIRAKSVRSAVDTNVLLDILTGDRIHGDLSRMVLEGALSRGKVVICDTVFAELAAAFDGDGDLLDEFLGDIGIKFDACSKDVFLLSGKTWRKSGRRKFPARVLPDFIIGAHARIHADCLLTRDRGFYAQCFDGLKVVDPTRL